MTKKVMGLSLSEEVIQRIDETRGLTPRSAIVEHLLRKKLGMEEYECYL